MKIPPKLGIGIGVLGVMGGMALLGHFSLPGFLDLSASIFTGGATSTESGSPAGIPTYDEETTVAEFTGYMDTSQFATGLELSLAPKIQKINEFNGNGPDLDAIDVYGNGTTNLGDLDGDGVTDLLVGAVGDDDGGSDRGAVFIHFMNTNGTIKATQKISELVGGGPTLDDGDVYGNGTANLGDLDGDGVTDIAVGAQGDDDGGTDNGAVYIHFMNTNGTVKATQKISELFGGGPTDISDDSYGVAITGLGDLDGDTVPDIAVGSFADDGGIGSGAVYIHFLNTNGTVKATQKISELFGGGPDLDPSDFYGGSVVNAGDIDGDGITDIVVGAQGDDDGGNSRGAVYVTFLNANGTVKAFQKVSSITGNGPVLNDADSYGGSIANLGDFDGDGVPDMAVGAFRDDSGGNRRGAVYIHFMNIDGTVKATQKISSIDGNGPTTLNDNNRYGSSLANIGDLDGDGVADIAVGARFDSEVDAFAGAVYVHFMESDGTVRLELGSTGSYATPVEVAPGDVAEFFSWDRLLVNQTIPTGTTMTYEIYASGFNVASGCTGASLLGPFSINNEGGGVEGGTASLSSIDAGTHTELCLTVRMTSDPGQTETPELLGWRVNYHTDSDGDGFSNYEETVAYACLSDEDDGSVNINFGPAGDADGDGLSNLLEIRTHGTDPCLSDTDGDGQSDGEEVTSGNNPNRASGAGGGKQTVSSGVGFGVSLGSGRVGYSAGKGDLKQSAVSYEPLGGIDRRIALDSRILDKRIGGPFAGGVKFESVKGTGEEGTEYQVFRGYYPGRIETEQFVRQNDKRVRYRGTTKTQAGVLRESQRSSRRNERSEAQRQTSLQERVRAARGLFARTNQNLPNSLKGSAEREGEAGIPVETDQEQTERTRVAGVKRSRESILANHGSRVGRTRFAQMYSAAETLTNARYQTEYNKARRAALAPKRKAHPSTGTSIINDKRLNEQRWKRIRAVKHGVSVYEVLSVIAK